MKQFRYTRYFHTALKHFGLAVSFLTRLPVPDLGTLQAPDFGRAALYYPMVGLLLGLLLCLPVWLFSSADSFLLAAILTVLWAALSGGLHLDGVADSADAWLGGLGDQEKTHRILKDPLVGAAGVIAVVSVLLLKCAALSVILSQGQWSLILVAPLLGRTLILVLFLTTPYVRSGGLASDVNHYLPKKSAIYIVLAGFFIAFAQSFTGLLAMGLGFWVLRRLMVQRLGGCTGDTAGASVEIGEVLWLVGAALL